MEVFSTATGPGAQCLRCHFRGGSLSVSPFRSLAGIYGSGPYNCFLIFFFFILCIYYNIKFIKCQICGLAGKGLLEASFIVTLKPPNRKIFSTKYLTYILSIGFYYPCSTTSTGDPTGFRSRVLQLERLVS